MDTTTSGLLARLEDDYAALGEKIAALKAHLTGETSDLPSEPPEVRLFRTRNGPFLNAIAAAGGAVTSRQFGDLGRQYGYDPRGLGGFATGMNPSIKSSGEMRVLTPRGQSEAERWRVMYGSTKEGS